MKESKEDILKSDRPLSKSKQIIHALRPFDPFNMQPYKYHPLNKATNEIRLVKLFPGKFEDDLEIDILHTPFNPLPDKTFTLSSLATTDKWLPTSWQSFETLSGRLLYMNIESGSRATWQHPEPSSSTSLIETCLNLHDNSLAEPRFEALSYTWKSSVQGNVFVYLTSHKTPVEPSRRSSVLKLLPVHGDALRFLRKSSEVRTLWIDAICINQDDLQERSEQVVRMADIYRCAERVVVWLGVPGYESTLALETLQYIGEQVQICKSGAAVAAPEAVDTDLWRPSSRLSLDESASTAVSRLLRRYWFSRLWIWQEIQLANSRAIVYCGFDSIEWDTLRRAIILLHEKGVKPAALRRVKYELVGNLAWCRKGHDLSQLLLSTAAAQNSEPRDRIYALLGLTETAFRNSIQPNYQLSVQSVYEDATVAYLRYHNDLRILGHSGWDGQDMDWPSWVPRLQGQELSLAAESLILYSAVHPTSFQYTRPGTLEIQGLHCADVEHAERECGSTLSTIRTWFPPHLLTNPDESAERLFDEYMQMLVLGYAEQRGVAYPMSTFIPLKECRDLYMNGDDNSASTPIHNMVSRCIKNQSFIVAGGLIGLGPASAQPGDKICMFLGSTWPVLLRPQPQGFYKFLGVCYVNGLMDSEALLGPLPPGFTRRWHTPPTGEHEPVPVYTHVDTPDYIYMDPRVDAELPSQWEHVGTDNFFVSRQKYRHRDTGEISVYHPGFHYEALEARGVKFETFRLT